MSGKAIATLTVGVTRSTFPFSPSNVQSRSQRGFGSGLRKTFKFTLTIRRLLRVLLNGTDLWTLSRNEAIETIGSEEASG